MAARVVPEVLDLLGSSSDDSSSDDGDDGDIPLPTLRPLPVQIDSDEEGEAEAATDLPGAFPVEHPPAQRAASAQPWQERRIDGGMVVVLDGDEVFIPDEESQATGTADVARALAGAAAIEVSQHHRDFTFEDCLLHVLEIFPDISHDHVNNLWSSFDHEGDYEILSGRARLDNIVEQLVSATTYPKEKKGKRKRKREESVDGPIDLKRWDRADRVPVPSRLKGSIAAILKADYPEIPRNHIIDRLATHIYLFQTYVALAKDRDDSEDGTRIFGRGRAGKTTTATADTIAINCEDAELVQELAAARLQVLAARSQREAAKAKKRAEEENLQTAIAAGETAECSACFEDLPMNRQIHCDGESAHFLCFECAETYIKSEVGDSRCKVVCPAGCGAGFAHNQLHLLGDKQLLEKLAQIQQEQDIREAGLEDLEDCPFCDFKAIMPPIEEDFEFRCANPECEKTSCRRCKAVSHIPISCEQHAKDNKLSSRHQIEEAMTAALVRSCQKCKKQFIKESGCNKMHCMSCGTLQCYVCSAIVKDYEHFDQGPHRGRTVGGPQSKKCPLYDNVEERHDREVKDAEAKTRAEIVENNPDVSAEDLEIKVSDAVKKAEDDRLKRAGVGVPRGHYAFLGGVDVAGAAPRPGAGLFDLDLGDDFDNEDLVGMLGAFEAHRPPRMPGGGDLQQARQRNRFLQRQLEMLRARHHQNQPAAPGAELDDIGRDAVDAFNQLYGNQPGTNGALQGYDLDVFDEGIALPQAQQLLQQPPAQQPAVGRVRGMPGLGQWANPFERVFGGPYAPRRPAYAAAPGNQAAANNIPHPAPDADFVPPRVMRRPYDYALALPFGRADNPYVPGAYPQARPPAAAPASAPPAPNNPNRQQLRDIEVLRMQHEDIERATDRRRQLDAARQRLQLQQAQLRHMQAGRPAGAGAGAEREQRPY